MSRRSNALMDSMQARMRGLRGISLDSMVRLLPRYRRTLSNLLAQMTADVHSINMSPDVAWTATMDSLQEDLIQLPEMTKPELRQGMPGHQARLSRLMTLHKEMMAKTAARSK